MLHNIDVCIYFKTCVITHNNNVIEQNINVSMFDILSVKEPPTLSSDNNASG